MGYIFRTGVAFRLECLNDHDSHCVKKGMYIERLLLKIASGECAYCSVITLLAAVPRHQDG